MPGLSGNQIAAQQMTVDPGIDGFSPQVSESRVLREMQNQGLEVPQSPSGGAGPGATTFGQMLETSLEKVNTLQAQSDDAIKELVAGRSKNIHETLLTIERADASLKLAMQVRNKILDAYREIMRMQV